MTNLRLKQVAASIALALSSTASQAVLERVGPINAAPGVGSFPAWYQDTTGLALEFCDPKNAAEVRRAVEPVIDGDARDRAPALGRAGEGAGARLEPPAQDIARHGLVLFREQVVQVARRHAAGVRDLRRRELRIGQVRLDVIEDPHEMRRGER